MTQEGLRGISFPFIFDGRGGVHVARATFTEADKVRQQVTLCIGTMLGERVMQPEYGTDLRPIPFELLNQSLKSLIRFKIVLALARWVPSVRVDRIELAKGEEGVIIVNVDYTVIDILASDKVTVPIGEGGV